MVIGEIVVRHSQEDEGEDFAPGLPTVLSLDRCFLCQQE